MEDAENMAAGQMKKGGKKLGMKPKKMVKPKKKFSDSDEEESEDDMSLDDESDDFEPVGNYNLSLLTSFIVKICNLSFNDLARAPGYFAYVDSIESLPTYGALSFA